MKISISTDGAAKERIDFATETAQKAWDLMSLLLSSWTEVISVEVSRFCYDFKVVMNPYKDEKRKIFGLARVSPDSWNGNELIIGPKAQARGWGIIRLCKKPTDVTPDLVAEGLIICCYVALALDHVLKEELESEVTEEIADAATYPPSFPISLLMLTNEYGEVRRRKLEEKLGLSSDS